MGCIVSREESTYDPPTPPFSPDSSRRIQVFGRGRNYGLALVELREALESAELNHVNLIVGIDFSTTNLHTGDGPNPYEDALPIIKKLWSTFQIDTWIHCYGFGNASMLDHDVFSFNLNESTCNGFEEVLTRYKEIVPHICISGPVSFAPIIEMAITKAVQISGQHNVLLIIADSQAFGSFDIEDGRLSPQEKKTIDAIVKASKFPLSIILVVVGDGPWDTVKAFADKISARSRAFDNFQPVTFTAANSFLHDKELKFCSALLKIPCQYEETKKLNISWDRKENAPMMFPLPPPDFGVAYGGPTPFAPYFASDDMPKYSTESHSKQSDVPWAAHPMGTSSSAPNSTPEDRLCPVCLDNKKDMAFGCGHQTCCSCGRVLKECPVCRRPIKIKIKLY